MHQNHHFAFKAQDAKRHLEGMSQISNDSRPELLHGIIIVETTSRRFETQFTTGKGLRPVKFTDAANAS